MDRKNAVAKQYVPVSLRPNVKLELFNIQHEITNKEKKKPAYSDIIEEALKLYRIEKKI